MSTETSLNELYDTIGVLIQSVTGREWWRSTGMQSQPKGIYATVYLQMDQPLQHQVVENVELEPLGENLEVFEQKPWGTTTVDCIVSFYRSTSNNSADEAATRFRNSLYIEKRFEDLWRIAGLLGSVRRLDISGAFRADIEPRTEVRFSFMANISEPGPVDSNQIYDIQSQEIDIIHVGLDNSETLIELNIDKNVIP